MVSDSLKSACHDSEVCANRPNWPDLHNELLTYHTELDGSICRFAARLRGDRWHWSARSSATSFTTPGATRCGCFIVTVISFPLIYINLELPKRIVNNAIGGKNLPQQIFGYEVSQVGYLMLLSFVLLALITLNGAIKYWLNVYRGIVGERMVRRLRYQLYEAVMRFPLPHFRKMSAGEMIPMITAETDPIGGFIGESIASPAFQGGLLITYMVFIFVQEFWLGVAAVALYPMQVWLIPRLQRRINQLSKRRILMTRELSDRIGDVIGGAAEIRANDTARYELADASARLGQDLRHPPQHLQAQVLRQVPEQLPGPDHAVLLLRGRRLLRDHGRALARRAGGRARGVQGHHRPVEGAAEVVRDEGGRARQVRAGGVAVRAAGHAAGRAFARTHLKPCRGSRGRWSRVRSSYSEDGGGIPIERLTLEVPQGQQVALVGTGESGKGELMRLFARLTFPTAGRLAIGKTSLSYRARRRRRAPDRIRVAQRARVLRFAPAQPALWPQAPAGGQRTL